MGQPMLSAWRIRMTTAIPVIDELSAMLWRSRGWISLEETGQRVARGVARGGVMVGVMVGVVGGGGLGLGSCFGVALCMGGSIATQLRLGTKEPARGVGRRFARASDRAAHPADFSRRGERMVWSSVELGRGKAGGGSLERWDRLHG